MDDYNKNKTAEQIRRDLKDAIHLLDVAIRMKQDHSSQADAVTQMMAREEWPHFLAAVERFKERVNE